MSGKTTNLRRTASERLFEAYLSEHQLADFEFEPEVKTMGSRPDYRVSLEGSDIFFEVKEFAPHPQLPSGGSFDVYRPIRSKINDAREKFRCLKGHMCALVLANPHGGLVLLDDLCIWGAMFGNVVINVPFGPVSGSYGPAGATSSFHVGGKMIRYSKKGQPVDSQNTTISAICVLAPLAEGSRRLQIRIANWERNTGTTPSLEELACLVQNSRHTDADCSIQHLRLAVYENPYAATRLTQAFASGPYDERFGSREGCLSRLFVGSSLQVLEAEEAAVGIESRHGSARGPG